MSENGFSGGNRAGGIVKKRLLAVAVCLVFLAAGVRTCRAAVDMGIATGSENGTYYRFGLDLKRLMAPHGIRLTVHPSSGSVDNIYTVYKVPAIQLGIVQSDVLAFVLKDVSNKTLRTIAGKIDVVFPLYDEEVHILARKGIRSFSDLAGKRVAVGWVGSGTYLTAKLLFEASGTRPARMLNIGGREALAQLKDGGLDAMFFVAGAPVKLFSDFVTNQDDLHLVPVEDPKILQYYPEAVIPANTYDWQPSPVETVEVKAVLVAYAANGECSDVCRFAEQLYDDLGRLAKEGHPKWKSVDLQYDIKGWPRCDCVNRILGLPVPEKGPLRPNPVFDAIEKALK